MLYSLLSPDSRRRRPGRHSDSIISPAGRGRKPGRGILPLFSPSGFIGNGGEALGRGGQFPALNDGAASIIS